jgi:hypothetical protein
MSTEPLADRFARMDVTDYNALISATLQAGDMKGTAAAIQLMALYHPREAASMLAMFELVRDAR